MRLICRTFCVCSCPHLPTCRSTPQIDTDSVLTSHRGYLKRMEDPQDAHKLHFIFYATPSRRLPSHHLRHKIFIFQERCRAVMASTPWISLLSQGQLTMTHAESELGKFLPGAADAASGASGCSGRGSAAQLCGQDTTRHPGGNTREAHIPRQSQAYRQRRRAAHGQHEGAAGASGGSRDAT